MIKNHILFFLSLFFPLRVNHLELCYKCFYLWMTMAKSMTAWLFYYLIPRLVDSIFPIPFPFLKFRCLSVSRTAFLLRYMITPWHFLNKSKGWQSYGKAFIIKHYQDRYIFPVSHSYTFFLSQWVSKVYIFIHIQYCKLFLKSLWDVPNSLTNTFKQYDQDRKYVPK